MSRRKMNLPLTVLTAVTALSGCGSNLVKSNGDVITMNINGKETKITVDELFGDYLSSPTGLQKYYDAVYEAIVREEFETNQKVKRDEAYETADGKVSDIKKLAKENASTGESYDKELEKLLKAENVETIKEYKEKQAYLEMKAMIKDQYFEGGSSSWNPQAWQEIVEGVGETEEDDKYYKGWLQTRMPYHVRHILVKLDTDNNNFYSSKITRANANKLGSTVKTLAERGNNDTFGNIAKNTSEDTSASSYGDLGFVTTETQFVNEFKLGMYAYDAYFNQNNNTSELKANLNIPDEAVNHLETKGIGKIPYEAALKLIEFKDTENQTLNVTSETTLDKEVFYPRNIYFNKYFNDHNISVITPNSVNPTDFVGSENATFANLPGFQEVEELGGDKYLTDENGNPILVTRAGSGYEGVHFIVIERSALDEVGINNPMTLADYYSVKTPQEANFPKDKDGRNLRTYVNFYQQNLSDLSARATTLKNEIKGFDPRIEDRVYKQLSESLNVEYHDSVLKEKLDEYLDQQYLISLYKNEEETANQWDEWIDYLKNHDESRLDLLPESYVADFLAGKSYKIGD